MKLAIISTLLTAAVAFQGPVSPSSARPTVALHETKSDLQSLATSLNPVVKYYDPWNLSDQEFWGSTNAQSIGWLRHAEIKHGRVAMFAFVGFIVHANQITWPWPMTTDGQPFPKADSAPAAWDAIPEAAKIQIVLFVGFLEFWSEVRREAERNEDRWESIVVPLMELYHIERSCMICDPSTRRLGAMIKRQ